MPVDPLVVAARMAGLSHGFLVFDDTGSEWTRIGRDVYAPALSQSVRLQPRPEPGERSLLHDRAGARRSPAAARPPAACESSPQTALLPAGEALVSWVTPRDTGPAGTLGFFATLDGRDVPRELIPLAGPPGERVEMHLRGPETGSPARRSSFGAGR